MPKETDSFIEKVIKVAITPFTFLTMGVTSVGDNLLQYFKDNHIEKLYEDLQHCNDSSRVLHDSQSLGL